MESQKSQVVEFMSHKKILVLGLDCAAPEILFEQEGLVHFKRLMRRGIYGRLESVIPPITVPAWMCLATGQDPGSLGVYGFRNRTDYSYEGLGMVSSRSIQEPAIWDYLAREGKRSVVVGVPPGYPARKLHGVSVGCFLTPDTTRSTYTHPPELRQQIDALVGTYPVDVRGFRTDDKKWLKDEILRVSRSQFKVVRHLMKNESWDYFQFVDIGLDRMHHGFWKYHDPLHRDHQPGNPYQHAIRDYYRHLDEELGSLMELIDDQTVVLVVSDHGAQRLDGGFCVNEWLIQQGLLVLYEYPESITPFSQLKVNWEKTRVWSEGGYYARIFFNLKDREPQGVIEPEDYEPLRTTLKQRFESMLDDTGSKMGTEAFRPEEIYRKVTRIAPDLLVHFGGLYWRSIGGVGYSSVYQHENDTGPDDCNHAQFGAFIFSDPSMQPIGEVNGSHLLDMAPTLMDCAGYDIPKAMQGRSLCGRHV